MRIVSGEIYRTNKKAYFIFIPHPPRENLAVYEIMWKNMLELCRSRMTIGILWRMRFACRKTKATNTCTQNMQHLLLSASKMVKRTHLNITLQLQCLFC